MKTNFLPSCRRRGGRKAEGVVGAGLVGAFPRILIAIAAALIFAPASCLQVYADRVDDARAAGKEVLCEAWAHFYARGESAAWKGIPMMFFHITPLQNMQMLERMLEHGEAPKPGIYIEDDGPTEQEKRFAEDAMSDGYQAMTERKKADPEIARPDPQRWQTLAQQCSDEI
jgi:hypothetical protein